MPNGETPEEITHSAYISKQRYQQEMFILLNSKKPTAFQDISKTNDLLNKAGMTDSIETKVKDQLCSVLGVSNLIFGNVRMAAVMPKKPAD